MSPRRQNPFPGMNPYMEERWPDMHTTMISMARRQLQRQLPDDLLAQVEHDLKVGPAADDANYRPDVEIREPWEDSDSGNGVAVLTPSVPIAQPIVVKLSPRPQRRIAIIDASGTLITVIELLSPSNKKGSGLQQYRMKREDFITSGVSVVEIDLVRAGGLLSDLCCDDTVLDSLAHIAPAHVIMVTRGHGLYERELYPVSYQVPLPAFRIPLRPKEPDIILDLQAIVKELFEDAALWHSDYLKDPEPPLRESDSVWLNELLKAKGLR